MDFNVKKEGKVRELVEGQRIYFKWRIFFNSSTRKKWKIVLRWQKYLDFLVVLNGAYLKKV